MPANRAAAPRDRDLLVLLLVALGWVASRAVAVISVDLTPWNLHDLGVYSRWVPTLSAGVFPAADPMWQYPPGAAVVFTVADRLPLDFRWGFTGLALAVDAAIMGVLLVARWRRPTGSWRGPVLWAAAGLIVGSILLARFDVVPTLFAVTAVLLAARPTRPVLAGAAAAVGALVKVWPGLMLLVLPRRALPRGLAAAAVVAALALVLTEALTTGGLSFLRNQGSRGLQLESVGALPYLLTALWHGEVLPTALQYGSIQVVRPGTEAVGLAVTALGIAVLATIALQRVAGRLECTPPGDVGLVLVLVAVASSRVYSPQFNTWLVGLAAVALLDRRSRMLGPVVIVVAVSVLTQVVYPWRMSQLTDGDALTAWLQTLRIAGLLAATTWAVLTLWRSARRPQGDGAGGGDVERVDTAGHGDPDGYVAPRDGLR